MCHGREMIILADTVFVAPPFFLTFHLETDLFLITANNRLSLAADK